MKATTLRSLRQWHHLIGVFLAPAILFFAFSGLIQVLGWQDLRDPPPSGWVSAIAGIHKHQMLPKPSPAQPERKPGGAPAAADDDHDHGGLTPLKIFALLTAIGLFTTTLIGLTIALGTRTMRRKSLIALGLGIVVPVVLLVV
ncbi:MAG TPA: hypothetical protein VF485_12630 [Sphingomonas sp.]